MNETITTNFNAWLKVKIKNESEQINQNIRDRSNGNEFEIEIDLKSRIKRVTNEIMTFPEYYMAINALYVIDIPSKVITDKIHSELNKLIEKEFRERIDYPIVKYTNKNGMIELRIVRQRKD